MNLEMGACVYMLSRCRGSKQGGTDRAVKKSKKKKKKSGQSVPEAFTQKPRRVIACSTPQG